MENLTKKTNQKLQKGELSLFTFEFKGQIRHGGEWIENKGNMIVRLAYKRFYPVEIPAISVMKTSNDEYVWDKLTQKGEYYYFENANNEYRINGLDLEKAYRTINIVYRYQDLEILATFHALSTDDDGEITYQHSLTGQMCQEVSQILSGWSEQDPEKNTKWAEMIELIEVRDDINDFWWGYDGDIKIQL